jgi:hypothetical protein
MRSSLLVLAALLLVPPATLHAAERNVLLIISGDQGYNHFGFTANKLVVAGGGGLTFRSVTQGQTPRRQPRPKEAGAAGRQAAIVGADRRCAGAHTVG